MLSERRCNTCGTKITGRPDKKFCSDKCRSHYNYAQRPGISDISYRAVDDLLKNNRELLKVLYTEGKKRVSKSFLVASGFNFEFYTNIKVSEGNGLCFFCYDVGYSIVNESEICLVTQTVIL